MNKQVFLYLLILLFLTIINVLISKDRNQELIASISGSVFDLNTYKEKCKHFDRRIRAIKRIGILSAFFSVFIFINRSFLEIYTIYVFFVLLVLVVCIHNLFFLLACVFYETEILILLLLSAFNYIMMITSTNEVLSSNFLIWIIFIINIIMEAMILIKLYKKSGCSFNFNEEFYRSMVIFNVFNIILLFINFILCKVMNIQIDILVQYFLNKYLLNSKNMFILVILTILALLYMISKKKRLSTYVLLPIIALSCSYTYLFHSDLSSTNATKRKKIDDTLDAVKYSLIQPDYHILFSFNEEQKYQNGIDLTIKDNDDRIEEGKFIVSNIRYSYMPKVTYKLSMNGENCSMKIENNTIGSLRNVSVKLKTNDEMVNNSFNAELEEKFTLEPGEHIIIEKEVPYSNGFDDAFIDTSFDANGHYCYYERLTNDGYRNFSNQDNRTYSSNINKVIIQGNDEWVSDSISIKDIEEEVKILSLSTKQDAEFDFYFMFRIEDKWFRSQTYHVDNHVNII